MARLSEEEKAELLEDARSHERRKDFAALREGTSNRRLSLPEYLEFLNWSQQFMKEDPKARRPIQGNVFIL